MRRKEGGPRSPHASRHALAAQRPSPSPCIPLPASFPACRGKAICIKPNVYRGVKSLSGFSDRTEHPSPHPSPGGDHRDHRDAANVPMSRTRRWHTGRSQLQNLPARFEGSPLPRDRSPPPPAAPLGLQGCWIRLITFSDHWTVKSAQCCGPLRGSSAISSSLPGSSEQINSHPRVIDHVLLLLGFAVFWDKLRLCLEARGTPARPSPGTETSARCPQTPSFTPKPAPSLSPPHGVAPGDLLPQPRVLEAPAPPALPGVLSRKRDLL